MIALPHYRKEGESVLQANATKGYCASRCARAGYARERLALHVVNFTGLFPRQRVGSWARGHPRGARQWNTTMVSLTDNCVSSVRSIIILVYETDGISR